MSTKRKTRDEVDKAVSEGAMSVNAARELLYDERRLLVPIDSVHPDPANARERTPRNLATIRIALETFGQQKPIVVDADGKILAGNGTWQVAKDLGWTEIWITRSALTGANAAAYAVVDNRAGDQSQFDEGQLVLTLGGLPQDLLAATGFDSEEIDHLLPQTMELDQDLDGGDSRKSLRAGADGRHTVRVMMAITSVAEFEQALQNTRIPNREKAFLAIMSFYNEHHPGGAL